MNTRTLLASAALAASSILTSQAHAQPIADSFTYQGNLNDSGVPANGLYDITFVVYDSEFFGSAVFNGTATVSNVEVVDGLFEAYVEFGPEGNVFNTTNTRWLQVQVSEAGQPGFTTLTPRQRIAPTPVSTYALRSSFAETSGSSLQNAYDNGNTIVAGIGGLNILANATLGNKATLRLGIGGPNNGEGKLEIFANSGPLVHSLGTESFIGAGEHIIYQSNGEIANYSSASFTGGGFFNVFRSPGSSGTVIEGGNGESKLSIFGANRSMMFDTNQSSSDLSVILPTSSINASEILDEVGGAASQNGNGSVNLTPVAATIDIIDSVTISVPAPGYVLVLASLEATAGVTEGLGATNANFGVSASSFSLPNNGDVELRYPTSTPTGEYDSPVTIHGFFPASTGAQTFYLLGDQNSTVGTFTAFDTQLTAIYIPTLYGSSTVESGINLPDELAPIRGSLTEYEVLLKRNAALEANDSRMQQEMDEIKAQMQLLMEQSDREFRQRIQD